MFEETVALIEKGTTIDEIKASLEEKYFRVETYTNDNRLYVVSVFLNSYDMVICYAYIFGDERIPYSFGGVQVSTKISDNSVELMKHLCNKFGGELDENDKDGIGSYIIKKQK